MELRRWPICYTTHMCAVYSLVQLHSFFCTLFIVTHFCCSSSSFCASHLLCFLLCHIISLLLSRSFSLCVLVVLCHSLDRLIRFRLREVRTGFYGICLLLYWKIQRNNNEWLADAATAISVFVCMRVHMFFSFILHMFAGIEFRFYSLHSTNKRQWYIKKDATQHTRNFRSKPMLVLNNKKKRRQFYGKFYAMLDAVKLTFCARAHTHQI